MGISVPLPRPLQLLNYTTLRPQMQLKSAKGLCLVLLLIGFVVIGALHLTGIGGLLESGQRATLGKAYSRL